MNIESLIASKIASRTASGLGIVVEYDNAEPFKCYAKDKLQHAQWLANFTRKIGTVDELGSTITAVRVA